MHKVKWTLKRAVLGGALASVAVAVAAFVFVTYVSEGSHGGVTGTSSTENQAQPLTVAFADGVAPGQPKAVSLGVTNSTSAPIEWIGPRMTIETPSAPTCAAQMELFSEEADGDESIPGAGRIAGTNKNKLEPIPPGGPVDPWDYVPGSNDPVATWLRFKSSVKPTDTACAAQEVIVTAHLE